MGLYHEISNRALAAGEVLSLRPDGMIIIDSWNEEQEVVWGFPVGEEDVLEGVEPDGFRLNLVKIPIRSTFAYFRESPYA